MYIVFILLAIIAIVALVVYGLTQKNKNDQHKPQHKHEVFDCGFDLYETKAEKRGDIGEKIVATILGDNVENTKYVFNDYYLMHEDKSVQIDHIYVTCAGVFVIETKNYVGMIFGNENQLEWTRVRQYGKVKEKFYNPIRQNKTHIYHLSKILPKNIPIYSIVVFVDSDISNVDSEDVVGVNDLAAKLDSYEATLDAKQLVEVVNILKENNNTNKITRGEHVQSVKAELNNIDNNICPRCGGELVLRHGQYGDFYGCSNYPKCKFKKKI